MDPYDVAAERLPARTLAAISAFWDHFEQHSGGLDRGFSSGEFDRGFGPSAVMRALDAVSPDLMWEFGPSDRGHHLCITAEWTDALRPLAPEIRVRAPDLPRWRFDEAREPVPPGTLAGMYEARFRRPLALSAATATLGAEGRIDLALQGAGTAQEVFERGLGMASMLLGEEVERDWLGFVEGKTATPPGLLARIRRPVTKGFDPTALRDAILGEIGKAKAQMPERRFADWPLTEREVTLFSVKPQDTDEKRSDLFVFATAVATYGKAILSRTRFSSRSFSRHGEWFFYLCVPRGPDAPFDDVDERYALEAEVQAALAPGGLGGVVAGGHGTAHVYVDCAATDVAQAMARLELALADKPYAAGVTLHFLDVGLTSLAFPLITAKPRLQ